MSMHFDPLKLRFREYRGFKGLNDFLTEMIAEPWRNVSGSEFVKLTVEANIRL
jgi:hypothetical protein